jgi:hypothetical protein
MQMTEAIRQRAGYSPFAGQTQVESAEPEQAPDVDFAAGVRGTIQPAPDMSALIRSAAFGGHIQQGGR